MTIRQLRADDHTGWQHHLLRRFAGSGDKRVLGTTTDIFVTHRIVRAASGPGPAPTGRRRAAAGHVNSDSIDQEPRITATARRSTS